jgi:predicted MFS family arabinose efflux permease
MLAQLTKKSYLLIALLGIYMCLLYVAEGFMAAILSDISREFRISVGTAGQLSTILGIVWGLSAPLIGPISDRLGRRWMLINGHLVAGLALVGYCISPSLLFLVGFSVLLGIGGAMGGPATLAAVGDHFPAQIRGRVMSIVNIGAPAAALVGVPLLAVIAGNLGWRWGFLLLGLFVISAAVSGIAILPKRTTDRPVEKSVFTSSITAPFRQKWLLPLLLAVAMVNGANYVVSVYFVAFLMQTYALTIAQVGPFLSLMALGQLLGVIVGGPLADRFSKIKISAVMHGLTGLSAVALMSFHDHLWLSVCLGGLFLALGNTARASYLSLFTFVPSESRSTVMGIQSSENRFGRAAGAATGGLVLFLLGYTYLGVFCLMFNVVAVVFFLRAFYLVKRMPYDQVLGFT